MKPFNLEEALNGAPVRIGYGARRVYDLHLFDRARVEKRLYGVIDSGEIYAWSIDGIFGHNAEEFDGMHLRMWEEGDNPEDFIF